MVGLGVDAGGDGAVEDILDDDVGVVDDVNAAAGCQHSPNIPGGQHQDPRLHLFLFVTNKHVVYTMTILLHGVQSARCTVHVVLYSARYTKHGVKCTVYRTLCIVHGVQCTVYSNVQYLENRTWGTEHGVQYSTRCTVQYLNIGMTLAISMRAS